MIGQIITATDWGPLVFTLSDDGVWSCTDFVKDDPAIHGDDTKAERAEALVEYLNATKGRVADPCSRCHVGAVAKLLRKFTAFKDAHIRFPGPDPAPSPQPIPA